MRNLIPPPLCIEDVSGPGTSEAGISDVCFGGERSDLEYDLAFLLTDAGRLTGLPIIANIHQRGPSDFS